MGIRIGFRIGWGGGGGGGGWDGLGIGLLQTLGCVLTILESRSLQVFHASNLDLSTPSVGTTGGWK